MGKALGLGGGKKAAKYDLTGYTYAKNNPLLQQSQAAGSGALGLVGGALGLGGVEGQQQSFGNFLNSIGYQSQLKAGQDAIAGSAAARGMLNSGATLKALNSYGQNLAQQGYQNYLANLMGVSNLGQSAALGTGELGKASAGESYAKARGGGLLGRLPLVGGFLSGFS